MDVKEVDKTFAGTKPAIQGRNSKEQWRMENYQSLYGNRLLDFKGANDKENYQKYRGVQTTYPEREQEETKSQVDLKADSQQSQKEQDETLWNLR